MRDEGKTKVFLAIVISILSVVSILSGCVSSDNVSASEIKIFTLQSYLDINSYEFSLDMTMNTGPVASMMSMVSTANGVVDVVNRRFMMEMSSSFSMLMEMNFLYYIVDDMIFMKMDYFGTEQWMKMDYSEFNVSWNSYDQMQMQVDLLEYGEVERLDDEIVNNNDCYVLKILPNVDKLFEIMMNQNGLSAGMLQISNLSNMLNDFSIKIWISKETNLIMKAYEYMTMDMDLYEYSTSTSMEITILFTNYNKTLNIELPEEAINATSYSEIFSIISPA